MQLEIQNNPSFEELVEFFSKSEHFKYLRNAVGVDQETIDKASDYVFQSFGSYLDSRQGLANLLTNFEKISSSPDHRELEAHVKDIIIVSAGPGLYTDIVTLKKHYDRGAFIIAVDAVTKLLLHEKIIPRIIVTSERNELTSSFFEQVDLTPLRDTILAASPLTHPHTLFLWPYRVVFMRPSLPELNWIPWRSSPSFQCIPVVSSFAAVLAKSLCPERIFLVGQDLSYHPLGRSHADLRNEKYNGHAMDSMPQKLLFNVPGTHLKEVVTNTYWFQFGLDLSRILKGMEVYTTSMLGAKIPHTEFKTLSEVDIDYSCQGVTIASNTPKVDEMRLDLKCSEAIEEFGNEPTFESKHLKELGFSLLIKEYVIKQNISFQKPEAEEQADLYFSMIEHSAARFLLYFVKELKAWANK